MSVAACNNDELSVNHATVPKARSATYSARRSINQDRGIYMRKLHTIMMKYLTQSRLEVIMPHSLKTHNIPSRSKVYNLDN